jgi:hypothetical protein
VAWDVPFCHCKYFCLVRTAEGDPGLYKYVTNCDVRQSSNAAPTPKHEILASCQRTDGVADSRFGKSCLPLLLPFHHRHQNAVMGVLAVGICLQPKNLHIVPYKDKYGAGGRNTDNVFMLGFCVCPRIRAMRLAQCVWETMLLLLLVA